MFKKRPFADLLYECLAIYFKLGRICIMKKLPLGECETDRHQSCADFKSEPYRDSCIDENKYIVQSNMVKGVYVIIVVYILHTDA